MQFRRRGEALSRRRCHAAQEYGIQRRLIGEVRRQVIVSAQGRAVLKRPVSRQHLDENPGAAFIGALENIPCEIL